MLTIKWCENMRGAFVHGIRSHLSLRKRHEIMAYAMGITEPHYPVPAIRQGFEFGLQYRIDNDLTRRFVTLLHWQQGPF